MHTIPILHASQAFPFIKFLSQAGCPTHKLLKKASLPEKLAELCDGFIAEQQLWELLEIASRDEGMEQFGLDVGQTNCQGAILCKCFTFYSAIYLLDRHAAQPI